MSVPCPPTQADGPMAPLLRILPFALLLAATAVAQPIYVVTTSVDTNDGTCDAHCTLREAILAADATEGGTILFSGMAPGDATITVNSTLPLLWHPTTIDGTTHPDGRVAIDGSALTAPPSDNVGLRLRSASVIRGLAVHSFPLVGIEVLASGARIKNTYIGTDLSGMVALGNRDGLHAYVSFDLVVEDCVIAGNEDDGLTFFASGGVTLRSSFVGVGADGVTPLGNGGDGVDFMSQFDPQYTIGGDDPGAGNVIAYNDGAGVFVHATSFDGNAIRGNRIFENGGIGIDLGGNGPTPNDPGDADTGPNELQNFPDLITATIDTQGNLVVEYSVDSDSANVTYPLNIEFFVADAAGTGSTLLVGRDTYTFDDHGNGPTPASKMINLGNAVTLGVAPSDQLVATTTDSASNSSEFSPPLSLVIATVSEPSALPSEPILDRVYPNPLSDTATLRYALGERAALRVAVYDVLGREVARLADGFVPAGVHTVSIDARTWPSGVYVIRLETEGVVRTQRVTVAH